MNSTPNKRFIPFAIFCTVFMLQTAHAEQKLVLVTAPDQFTIQLPGVDREALVEQVRVLRSQLIERKQALLQIIADSEMDSGDAFITTILPGGLLYAGYQKVRYEQAKNELASINAEIEEFSVDLLAMQTGAMPVFVARLQSGK